MASLSFQLVRWSGLVVVRVEEQLRTPKWNFLLPEFSSQIKAYKGMAFTSTSFSFVWRILNWKCLYSLGQITKGARGKVFLSIFFMFLLPIIVHNLVKGEKSSWEYCLFSRWDKSVMSLRNNLLGPLHLLTTRPRPLSDQKVYTQAGK